MAVHAYHKLMVKRAFLLFLSLFAFAACQGTETPTPDLFDVPQNRILATVYISPTPNADQRQQTQIAGVPSATVAPPTLTPQPTAYVGVFIGEVQERPELLGSPVFDQFRQPTSVAGDCDITVGEQYVNALSSSETLRSRMGCPIQIAFGFFGAVQIFERGVMYQRLETREVWAIIPGGTGIGRYWYVEVPPPVTVEGISPPTGLRLPEADFASVWAGIDGVRTAMGFAQTPLQNVDLGQQRFDGGTLFLDQNVQEVFGLMANGDVYGPF